MYSYIKCKRASGEIMKLKEIANEINKYLKQFEANEDRHTACYYNSFAIAAGRFVQIIYVSYQGHSSLTKQEALEYLNWLQEGNVGRHYDMRR